MLLHVHKEFADGIDMVVVTNLLVGDNQQLKHLFDMPMMSVFASKATLTV